MLSEEDFESWSVSCSLLGSTKSDHTTKSLPRPTGTLLVSKMFFDLAHQEKWHRIQWEALLSRISASTSNEFAITTEFSNADIIIRPGGPSIKAPLQAMLRFAKSGMFTWDYSDDPSGIAPGLYCSLRKQLFSARAHRSFCYPIVFNELIDEFPSEDARVDWLFFGGITSEIRKRIIAGLSNRVLPTNGEMVIQSGPWNAMFDRSGTKLKRDYAAAIQRAKFVLCPRGNGVGSVRLFEVLKAGRVPIILADNYVLPTGIDWNSCSLLCKEANVQTIPKLVEANLHRWREMAGAARCAWEHNYSDSVMLYNIGSALTQLLRPRLGLQMMRIARERVRSKVVMTLGRILH
jgi:hypothetical protein